MHELRRKVWIDRMQTRLALRLSLMGLAYLSALWLALMAYLHVASLAATATTGGAADTVGLVPALLCLLALAPLFAYSVVKYSHKIVGPLVPLRRAIGELRDGRPVSFVRLREGDELIELAQEFNEMIAELARRGAVEIVGVPPLQNPAAELGPAVAAAAAG